jgi:hypothetical protein
VAFAKALMCRQPPPVVARRGGICALGHIGSPAGIDRLYSLLRDYEGLTKVRTKMMMDESILHDLEAEMADDRKPQLLAAALEARWLATMPSVSREMREQLLLLAWDSVREAGPLGLASR